MSHNYHFDVTMSCSGCSGAIERVLTKNPNISEFNVSLEKQTVDVKTDDSYDNVYNVIAKTGKKINGGKVVN